MPADVYGMKIDRTAKIVSALRDAIELQVHQWPDRASGFDAVMVLTRELAAALLADPASGPSLDPDARELLFSRGLFLGGSPKGGTTMFVQLFDGHQDLVVIPGDSRMVHLASAPPAEREIATLLGYWLRQCISPNALPPFWGLGEGIERLHPKSIACTAQVRLRPG